MSQVTFNIKILVDGKEKVVEAKTDVSKLADEFEKAKNSSTKLRDKLLEFNQAAQAFQNLTSGVQQLVGVFGQFSQAYADQEAAQTRLAVNMRNTMDASEGEIKSILDLVAAQQQLGVVGDEVQLVGAQELATYLSKKESLEQLIPVMNDMLVQQYGLNASQESAQNIATMLGKVMDGQVGALSRYGYKFDEAQEKILKYGSEQQRVAVLCDVVSSAVGGQNQAMRNTPSGEIKALSDRFGDLKEEIGKVTVQMQPYLNMLAQVGMAGSGLVNLATGFAGVARSARTLALSLSTTSAAATVWRSVSMATSAMLTVLRSAFTGAAVGATTLKVAIRGLMAATVVGLAIAALTWALEKLVFSSDEAADGLDGVSDASQRLQQQVDAEKSAYSNARVEMDKEIQKLGELIKSKGNTAGAVQELNNKYGEAFGYHKTASEWYKTLTENSEAYCRQLGLEAKMKVLAAQGADIDFDLEKNKREQERLEKEGKATVTSSTAVMTNQFGIQVGGGQSYTRDTKEMAALKESQEKLEKAKEQNKKDQAILADMMADTAKSIKTSPTAPTTPTGDVDKKTGKEPLKLIEQPKSLEDLKNNVQYYEQAVSKADKTDKEHLKTLVGKLDAAKQLVAAFEQDMEGMSLKLRLEGWQEIDKELRAKGISLEGKEAQPIGVPVVLKPEKQLTEWMPIAKPADTTTPDYKRSRYDFLSQQAQRVQQDFEIGIIGESEALRAIEDINAALRGLGLNEIEIPLQTENVDKAKKKFEGATDAVGQMGQSLAGLGSALELPELNIAGTIAQAIATMALGYAKASATPKDPFTWLAFAATGLAQLTAMIASVKQATAFAQGGIVSGPTMALVGEYAGASNNPEVIAPLDKLRSMIGPQEGISGRVVFKIEGRTLRGVLEREQHHLARS